MTDRIIPRHVFGILVCLFCFGAGAVAIPVQQYYRGKIEAYRDISQGTYRGWRCAYHFDPNMTGHFDQLVFKYANFQIETTNDCNFKNRGYTEVQMARINRLYPGVFERALNETIEWKRQQ